MQTLKLKFQTTQQLFTAVKDEFLIDDKKNSYRTPYFVTNSRTAKIRTANEALESKTVLYSHSLKAYVSLK